MKKNQNNHSKSSVVRVALTQMACTDNARENLDRQVKLLDAAARKGGKIICTQELFRSQYFCQVEDAARFDLMFAGIVTFAALGFVSDRILMAVRRSVLRGQIIGTAEQLVR